MEFFIESIDRGIRDAITNGPFIPKHEKDNVVLLKNLSLGGSGLNEKGLNMIVLPRTS